MKCKTPRHLEPGDTVALLAPSSPLAKQKELADCVRAAEELDLRVKQFPTLKLRKDFMAGTPQQRARDLHRAFFDDKVKGILCMRGGYSACHVYSLLDWKEIGKTRKLFAGFSDITAILTPMLSQSRLASLHAPTMSYFIKKNKERELSHKALERFLFADWKGISYRELCGKAFKPKTIRNGKAAGTLIGGNAAVFASLVGTPAMPKRGKYLLFLEDIGEDPYKLDRYVMQLILSGFFENVTGVLLGQFTNCQPKKPDMDSALTVMERLLKPLRIPVLAGFPIGHDQPAFPLPIGVDAHLDASKGELEIL